LFVYHVDVRDHLVAEEPGVIPLVANYLKGEEVGLVPVSPSCHVEVVVVKLVKE
jgi:hypothetical protein